jgi:hypothetical protein
MDGRFLKFGATLAAIAGLAWAFYSVEQGEASLRQVWGLGQANYHEFREKLRARQMPDFTAERFLHGAREDSGVVDSSHPGGFAQAPFKVELWGNGPIYYTTDGSLPTRRSSRYRGAIMIEKSTVLRARILDRGTLPGPVSTFHYISEPPADLPVVSIASDPVNLWNKYSGIHSHPLDRGRPWEREAALAYFESTPTAPVIPSAPAEIRIHGGYSRYSEKKSFRIRYPRDAFAELKADHLLYSQLQGEGAVVVRSDQRTPGSRARDAVASDLAHELGLLTSRRRPVELYINGEYWGVYDLRDRIDASFLQKRVEPGTYDLLSHDSENARQWLSPVAGDAMAWARTMDEIRKLDISSDEGLKRAGALIDISNFIDYWCHNIIVGNVDWPHNNITVYRRTDGEDPRWRWAVWDLDIAFTDSSHNTLGWAMRDRLRHELRWNQERGARDSEALLASTELFRRFLRNNEFRERFGSRIQTLAALHYTEPKIVELIEKLSAPLERALERDSLRWGWSRASLQGSLDAIARFAQERPSRLREHLITELGLGRPHEVRVLSAPESKILVEGYPIPADGATLSLLEGTRLRVTHVSGAEIVHLVEGPMTIGAGTQELPPQTRGSQTSSIIR